MVVGRVSHLLEEFRRRAIRQLYGDLDFGDPRPLPDRFYEEDLVARWEFCKYRSWLVDGFLALNNIRLTADDGPVQVHITAR